MRAKDFLVELRKKTVDPTPYDPGWEDLNWFKEEAHEAGKKLANTLQLFMPRRNPAAMTNRDRRLKNIASPYAYDDEGNLKPEYDKWERGIKETAPILNPVKSISPPGWNKPQANLWTSTARKLDNNTWTCDWVHWVARNQPDWMAPTGHLYRVKPGALVLGLHDDYDAERLYRTFFNLNRVQKVDDQSNIHSGMYRLMQNFPWDQVYKHFDAVWHSGYSRQEFLYGWDCESTAWLDTNFLEYVGEVQINQAGLSADEDY